MKLYKLLPLFLIMFITACTDSEQNNSVNLVNNDPETTNKLVFDNSKIPEYRKLTKELGFNYDQEYYWNAFSELMKSKGLGLAGQYEYFPGSSKDWFISPKAMAGWEFIYYKNVDMTVIYQIRHNEDRTKSYARFLKLAHGRFPDLDKR